MEGDKEFIKANFHLIETWSDFVKVSIANGETVEGIRKRLASNNLSEEQIDWILNPKSRVEMHYHKREKNAKYFFIGLLNLGAALVFLGECNYHAPIINGLCSVCFFAGGILSFSKIKRVLE